MTNSLAKLIQAVDTADSSDLLLEAVENLADACLEGAIPTLIKVLNYNNPGAAVAAVDGLIQLGEPAVPLLMEQLDTHNYTARSWAIRALAGIGDPRGLVTLLDAVKTDFSPSVRRGASKGLGYMQWSWFPDHILEIAQKEILSTLLFVAQRDDEWIVRYSAVVALQGFATAISQEHQEWRSQIETEFEQMATQDESLTVRARVWMAQQNLQKKPIQSSHQKEKSSPLSDRDWQQILEQLMHLKNVSFS